MIYIRRWLVVCLYLLLQEKREKPCRIFTFGRHQKAYGGDTQFLTTVWGEALDSSNVLPEYLASSHAARHHVMLNGVWDYTIVPVNGEIDVEILAQQGDLFPLGCGAKARSPPSGVGRTVQPSESLWYKRKIEPRTADDQRLILHLCC